MGKIGILGGTFDPPHWGHLVIAEFVADEFGLDEVYFCPAYCPPHKTKRILNPPEMRLEMVKLSCQGSDKFIASDLDIRHHRVPSYTFDLLNDFRKIFPKDEFYLIIGGDSALQFTSWHRWMDILQVARPICVRRYGNDFKFLNDIVAKSIVFSNAPLIEISSTEIRKRIADGKSIRYMVHPDVGVYIAKHKLYKNNP